jgi:hypothetical protein
MAVRRLLVPVGPRSRPPNAAAVPYARHAAHGDATVQSIVHAPAPCAGRCAPRQSARRNEGAWPYGLRCLYWDPRRNVHDAFAQRPFQRLAQRAAPPVRHFLSGGHMEVVTGDGTTRRFGPGDVVLFEDLTGQGHTSRSVGGDRLTAIVPLAD